MACRNLIILPLIDPEIVDFQCYNIRDILLICSSFLQICTMELTAEQQAVLASNCNLVINAVAGSGKTTALIEYAKQ